MATVLSPIWHRLFIRMCLIWS